MIGVSDDAPVQKRLNTLRTSIQCGDIAPEVEVFPGIRFVCDPNSIMKGQYKSHSGRLLELKVSHQTPARWFGLHFKIESVDLSDFSAIGFYSRMSAPKDIAVRPCIRSGAGDSFVDTFFPYSIAVSPRPSMHLDALEAHYEHEILSSPVPWREFILFMPTGTFCLGVHDLRIFTI